MSLTPSLPGQVLFSRVGSLGLACSLALNTPLLSARAANRVQKLVLGHGSALAACDGLHSNNDNRAQIAFAANPAVIFHARLPGGIGQAPVTDSTGNLIISHVEPRLSKLDSAGRTRWSERLPSEASCAPTISSDGSIFIVTLGAEALQFSTSGKLLKRQALPLSDPRRRTSAIPTASGGILVASGSDLVQLDAEAQIVRQTRARAPVSAILESGPDLLAVSENGSVELARESGGFESLGSFGGSVQDGAAVEGGKVFALVDGHRWLALDLSTGATVTLASDPASGLRGPATLLANGGAAFVADGGFVSLRGPEGNETLRSAFSVGRAGFDPLPRGSRGALLISDLDSRVLAVRSGEDALLIGREGNSWRVEGTSCLDPFRPTPTQHGLVLSCRSGQIFVLGAPGRDSGARGNPSADAKNR